MKQPKEKPIYLKVRKETRNRIKVKAAQKEIKMIDYVDALSKLNI